MTRRILSLAVLFLLCANLVLLLMELAGGLSFLHFVKKVYIFNTFVLPLSLLAITPIAWSIARIKRDDPSLRLGLHRSALWSLAVALPLGALHLWCTHIEPSMIQVRRVTIETPKLTQPLRILHITDIQSFGIGRHEVKAFAIMRQLAPDLVLHTGDLLQPKPPLTQQGEVPKIARLFETLDAPLGIYNIKGDVDPFITGELMNNIGGMRTLADESLTIDSPAGPLTVFGMTNPMSIGRDYAVGRVEGWLTQTPPETFTILIGHRPDYILTMNELPIDLCLAGHTHGGQIRIPGYGPLVTFSWVPRQWARGFHEIGATRLNVSAGIGAEHAHELPSIRLFCPPEMTLIECVPVPETQAQSQ